MRIWEFWNWEGESRYFSTEEKAEIAAIQWMLATGEDAQDQIKSLLDDGYITTPYEDTICSISEISVE